MVKMRAMVVRERGGPFVAEERDIPTPGPEEMRIRVQACGVCHSDVVTVQGLFPIVQYPRVPGHEVIGIVDAIGEGVHGWNVGARAGSAGSAARAAIAANAGATMRSSARMCTKSAVSRETAATLPI
jgi:D-arabinose 1-dehydrogenase-like Zn-dependent alcohol dehydrogenase